MKLNFFKNKYCFLVLSIIQILISFFTERYFFDFNNINLLNYILCKIIYIIITLVFYKFLYDVIINKNIFKRQVLKYAIPYFLILVFIILITWPGIWVFDDLSFLEMAKTAKNMYYLSYLTSIFYIVSLMFVPIPSIVAITQSFCLSLVLGYIVSNIEKKIKFKHKYLYYLCFIPFLMPICLIYAIYPNRPPIYGIFLLLFFSIILFNKNKKLKKSTKYLTLFLCAIVSIWRNETIYLLVFGPLLLELNKFKIKNFFKSIIIVVAFYIILLIPEYYNTSYKNELYKENRSLPMIINPLSYMLNQDLKGENLEEELKKIDKVLNINEMKKYPSLDNVPSTWMSQEPIYRDFTKKEYKEMKKAYKNLIKNNFKLFIECKFYTFKRSIGAVPNNMYSANLFVGEKTGVVGDFLNNYYLTKPLHEGYRQIILGLLEGSHHRIYYIYPWFNNLIYPLILIFILCIISILKKDLFYFLTCGALIGQTLLMSLTSPASFFMYYYPLYLIMWLIIITKILEIYERKKIK